MLADDTQIRLYDKSDFDTLRADCEETESATVIMPLDSPDQLALTDDFKTIQGNYRYTWYALSQACRTLSSGLGRVIWDISGRAETKDEAPVSPLVAARMLNATVRTRFPARLMGWQLLVNTRTQTIEAVLGRGYRRLPNIVFLEAVHSTLSQSMRFDSAGLSGRRLVAYYIGDPHSTDILPTPEYSYGVVASNSETADAGVRVRRTVCLGSLACFQRPKDGLKVVRHTGRKFEDKIRALLLNAATAPKEDAQALMEAAWESCAQRNIGFTGTSDETDIEARDAVVTTLRHLGLSKLFCRKALRRALFSGGLESPDGEAVREQTAHLWSSRSWGDVLISLAAEVAVLPAHHPTREKVERLCYTQLFTKNQGDPFNDSC